MLVVQVHVPKIISSELVVVLGSHEAGNAEPVEAQSNMRQKNTLEESIAIRRLA